MKNFILSNITLFITLVVLLFSSPVSAIQKEEVSFVIHERESIKKDEECANPISCFSTAIYLFDEGDREEGINLLKKINLLYPFTTWNTRAAYLLGKELLNEEDSQALPYLIKAMDLTSIRDYILFDLAMAYRLDDKNDEAVNLYANLLEEYPDSLLGEEAFFEQAMTMIDDDNCSMAIEKLKIFIKKYPESEYLSDALLNLANCAIQSNREDEIAFSIKRLQTFYPVIPVEKEEKAEKIFSAISDTKLAALAFSEEERYQRGKAFYKQGMFDKAVESLGPLDNMKDEKALLFGAKAFFRTRKYSDAKIILSRIFSLNNKREPSSEVLDAYLLLGRISVRTKNIKALKKVEEDLNWIAPGSNQRGMVLLYLGGYFEDRKRYNTALDVYKTVFSDINNSNIVADALWKSAWIKYRMKQYKKAMLDFASYPEKFPDGYRYSDFLYWRGRCEEKLGFISKAGKTYRKILERGGASYYNYVALERLEKISRKKKKGPKNIVSRGNENNEESIREGIYDQLAGERAYMAAEELLILGFNEEAVNELELLAKKYSKDESALIKIIGMIYRSGEFHRTYRIVQNYFGHIYGGAWKDAPYEIKTLVFPLPVVNYVEKRQPSGSADPYLVAAIMREESSFNPAAISPAGAMGLMQIMPETGEYLAKKYKKRSFETEHLLDPDISIHLGGLYLGQLNRRFKGDIVYTIASYNAGPTAVSRWAKKNRLEKDEFIENMPYDETRTYTKRVLRSYSQYLKLAGKESPDLF